MKLVFALSILSMLGALPVGASPSDAACDGDVPVHDVYDVGRARPSGVLDLCATTRGTSDGEYEAGFGVAWLESTHHTSRACAAPVGPGQLRFRVGADGDGDGLVAPDHTDADVLTTWFDSPQCNARAFRPGFGPMETQGSSAGRPQKGWWVFVETSATWRGGAGASLGALAQVWSDR